MVTGQKPYTADTPLAVIFKHASQPLPRPRQFVPGLPGGVEKILHKALEKNPKDRYQNMDEMKWAFEKVLGGKTSKSFIREKATRGTPPQTTESRKEAKPPIRSSSPARNRSPIKFSRRGAGILIGVVVVVLAGWLGSPLMGMLFAPSPVPITPAITEIQSTPTTIKRIPSATIQASLTPATTFTPTLSPPTQTPLPEGVLFFDDFEGVQQNYIFYPSGDALQASIREWIPDGDHGNVLRVKPKEYGNIKFGEYSWTNYSLEFDFQMSGTLDNTNEENWFAIIMRASSENNYDQYVSFVQLFTKRLIHAYQSCPTYSYCLPIASIEGTSMPLRPDRWYHFKIEVINNLMLTYLDNNFILQSWDNRIKSGKPGFDFTWGSDMTFYFDNIRVEELK